jgi:ABC-2 type transport system ATP-binding protein
MPRPKFGAWQRPTTWRSCSRSDLSQTAKIKGSIASPSVNPTPVPAVEIVGIHKSFPNASGNVQALVDVNLRIEQGEFFALLGPNGAGKTTLISILAGLTKADSGVTRVMGFDTVREYRDARTNLGVVPQELVFDPFFTVRETLELQAKYYGVKNASAWIDEILEHLDLTSKAKANMRALSSGRRSCTNPR